MPEKIHLLPDAIANQIAAGEVVQRPASVVKELLENSIDAGATEIQLILNESGRTLIQVVDNGSGMSMTDARMSFERHATSKIRKIEDIYEIYTMGFRGEALASIAAVAQVELKTKQADDNLGTFIRIEGSKVITQEPCNHTTGTSISIRNLFFNVPARRNFLKSNQVELKHVMDEFIRVALANPELSFSFHNNNMELYHLKSGTLRQRIVGIFGKSLNDKLVPVEESTEYISVNGFIGKPTAAKKTRGEQYFFVNNRFIKSHTLNYAVQKAFEDLIPEKSYPFYVLFIAISPAAIDVNVHPTKQEIKFEDERSAFMIIQAAVKHGLAQYSVIPTLDFNQNAEFTNLDAFKHQAKFNENLVGKYTGGHGIASSSGRQHPLVTPHTPTWQSILPQAAKEASDIITLRSKMDEEERDNNSFSPTPTLFDTRNGDYLTFTPVQVHQKYLLAQISSGLVFIHIKRAKERILLEKYIKALNKQAIPTQQSLFPSTLEFSPQDSIILQELLTEMKPLGFDIQPFGTNTFVVHGLPTEYEGNDIQSVIETMIHYFKSSSDSNFDRNTQLAASLVKGMSMNGNINLDVLEIKAIIEELFACENPNYTADGKKIYFTTSLNDLEQQFS